jgi:hypothetical protein
MCLCVMCDVTFGAAEVKSESDGSPEKSKLHAEGVEEASSSVGAASSTGQKEGQSFSTCSESA